jgi:hypothetical protein
MKKSTSLQKIIKLNILFLSVIKAMQISGSQKKIALRK